MHDGKGGKGLRDRSNHPGMAGRCHDPSQGTLAVMANAGRLLRYHDRRASSAPQG